MIFVINKDFARIAETTHHRDGPVLLMCILSSWALLTMGICSNYFCTDFQGGCKTCIDFVRYYTHQISM